jgi:hypothetical protein
MLAVGSFSYALGKGFTKYLPTFMPYLHTGLANYKEIQAREQQSCCALQWGVRAACRAVL